MFNTEKGKTVWCIADILEKDGSIKEIPFKEKKRPIVPDVLSVKAVPENLYFDEEPSPLDIAAPEPYVYHSLDEASYAARAVVELKILQLTYSKRKNPEKVEYLSETLQRLGGPTQITLTPYAKYSIKTIDQVDPLD